MLYCMQYYICASIYTNTHLECSLTFLFYSLATFVALHSLGTRFNTSSQCSRVMKAKDCLILSTCGSALGLQALVVSS